MKEKLEIRERFSSVAEKIAILPKTLALKEKGQASINLVLLMAFVVSTNAWAASQGCKMSVDNSIRSRTTPTVSAITQTPTTIIISPSGRQ